jgi:hypothetical protein
MRQGVVAPFYETDNNAEDTETKDESHLCKKLLSLILSLRTGFTLALIITVTLCVSGVWIAFAVPQEQVVNDMVNTIQLVIDQKISTDVKRISTTPTTALNTMVRILNGLNYEDVTYLCNITYSVLDKNYQSVFVILLDGVTVGYYNTDTTPVFTFRVTSRNSSKLEYTQVSMHDGLPYLARNISLNTIPYLIPRQPMWDWAQSAAPNTTATWFFVSDVNFNSSFFLASPLFNYAGQYYGYATVVLNVNSIQRSMTNFTVYGGGVVYIVEDTGRLIATSDRNAPPMGQVMMNSSRVFERMPAVLSSNTLIRSSAKYISQMAIFTSDFDNVKLRYQDETGQTLRVSITK